MRAALRLELARSRTLAIWLCGVAALYGGAIAFVYPVFRDNTKLLDDYLKLFPKGMLSAFGMEGSLADPGTFFSTYIGTYLWPIVAAIAAILVATRPVATDLDRGFLDLPLATPISRIRYLAAAIAGQAIVLVILAIVAVAAVVIAGAIAGAGFDSGRFLLVVPLALAFGCAIAAVATLLSVATLSRGIAGGITAAGLFAMYLMTALSKLQPDLDWLGNVSVFGHFRTGPIIDHGDPALPDVALFAVIALLAWGAALVAFKRRDLAA